MDKRQRSRYNKNWQVISYQIRVERADDKCEQCKIQNGILIKRFRDGIYRLATTTESEQVSYLQKAFKMKLHSAIKQAGLKRVVLSVAHINHIETDDRPENLFCGCQWCHLKHDRADNWMRRKRHKATQMTLFDLPKNNTHQNATQQQP